MLSSASSYRGTRAPVGARSLSSWPQDGHEEESALRAPAQIGHRSLMSDWVMLSGFRDLGGSLAGLRPACELLRNSGPLSAGGWASTPRGFDRPRLVSPKQKTRKLFTTPLSIRLLPSPRFSAAEPPVGPANSLGWGVGSGQCNGSFSATTDGAFPGGALELGLRAEQRRIGQVGQTGPNDYTVQTGPDVGPPASVNRAWWNFQGSIAYGGSIASLDALTLSITTDVGPNLPTAPVVDLLPLRVFIDDRNNQPNATAGFADLYQLSQNPEFGWFSPTSDTDPNPTGAFDYAALGAWRFTLTAVEGASSSSVSVCIHTPGQQCVPLNQAPDCSAEAPSVASLWPPNHKMVPSTSWGSRTRTVIRLASRSTRSSRTSRRTHSVVGRSPPMPKESDLTRRR